MGDSQDCGCPGFVRAAGGLRYVVHSIMLVAAKLVSRVLASRVSIRRAAGQMFGTSKSRAFIIRTWSPAGRSYLERSNGSTSKTCSKSKPSGIANDIFELLRRRFGRSTSRPMSTLIVACCARVFIGIGIGYLLLVKFKPPETRVTERACETQGSRQHSDAQPASRARR